LEIATLCRLLRSEHINYRGPDVAVVQGELRDSRSPLVRELQNEFGRVVVLDLQEGINAAGTFDIERFLERAWKQMASALGHYHDEAAFHPEQIGQLLKSEDPVLFCLLNVQHLTETDLHRLRGLGFAQQNHPILYVGANAAFQKVSYPLVDPEKAGGERYGVRSLIDDLAVIAPDSEALTSISCVSSTAGDVPPAPPPPSVPAPNGPVPDVATDIRPEDAPVAPEDSRHGGPGALFVVRGARAGTQIDLLGERMVIGRHPSCEIVIDNAGVSRNHAQILESQGTYFLEDLRSRNGTLLNGKRIQGRTALRDKDEIRLCDVLLRFFQSATAEWHEGSGPYVAIARGTASSESDSAAIARSGPVPGELDDESSADSSSIISSLDVANRGPQTAVRPEAKLRAVMEITQNLAQALKIDEVLPRILESLFRIFPQADRGFIVLKDAATGALQVRSSQKRGDSPSDSGRLSLRMVRESIDKSRAILSADAAADRRLSLSDSVRSLKIRSVMSAPLVARPGLPVGAVQIDTSDSSAPFSHDDLEVLASVAGQAALSLESAQLHAAALERRDLERDLDFASRVQLGFLPNERPRIEGYDIFDFYEAAQSVGGDFVDYMALPGGRMAISVGDVAGKGLPSALLMARICADARAQLLAKPSPAEALFSLHQSVVSSGPGDRFVTMLVAVLDPVTHALTLVNAGHLPPLLRHADGTVERLGAEECGLPLGIPTDIPFREKTLTIGSGELLVLYSDGLTEAMNAEKEIYGVQRLLQVVSKHGSAPQAAVEAVVADVDRFCGATPPRDDIFIVAFRRVATQ
jgi:serine phosphatase RsbU (regulator of sigma subunit)